MNQQPIQTVFDLHCGTETFEMTENKLSEYANLIGLDAIAPERYSWLFLMELMLHSNFHGINPFMVMDEIKVLEGIKGHRTGKTSSLSTKPAAEFKNEPLKGLWHKHFFAPRFIAKNIQNQLGKNGIDNILKEEFKKTGSAYLEPEMVKQLSYRIIYQTFSDRKAKNKLTGEWIIFQKYNGNNYYLKVCGHKTADHDIYRNIKNICYIQFPFLNNIQ